MVTISLILFGGVSAGMVMLIKLIHWEKGNPQALDVKYKTLNAKHSVKHGRERAYFERITEKKKQNKKQENKIKYRFVNCKYILISVSIYIHLEFKFVSI